MRLQPKPVKKPTQYTGKPDITDVFAHYGLDVPANGVYICLFHSEDNPSMSVNTEEGLFHCFSCGASGDVWTVIMLKEEIDYNGARSFATNTWELDQTVNPANRGTTRTAPSGYARTRVPRKAGPETSNQWTPPWVRK